MDNLTTGWLLVLVVLVIVVATELFRYNRAKRNREKGHVMWPGYIHQECPYCGHSWFRREGDRLPCPKCGAEVVL